MRYLIINPIHVTLNPKTSPREMERFQKLVNSIYSCVPNRDALIIEAKKIREEREIFKKESNIELFQAPVKESDRIKYDLVNYLIWTK